MIPRGRDRRGVVWGAALIGIGVVAGAVVLLGGRADRVPPAGQTFGPVASVTVYQSPTCACCGEYVDYLVAAGYTVEVVHVTDTAAIKRARGIPQEMWSCHTSEIEGYAVEGHVPVEAIRALLRDRPAIDGIALPGMPPGSPGMPGVKEAPFVIYSITDGGTDVFTVA